MSEFKKGSYVKKRKAAVTEWSIYDHSLQIVYQVYVWPQAGRSRAISSVLVFTLALCNGELLACPGCLIAASTKLNDLLLCFEN